MNDHDVNTQVTGASQEAGKSRTTEARDIVPWIEAAEGAAIHEDPHRSSGIRVAGCTIELGRADDLIIIDLESDAYATSPGIFFRSDAPRPFVRRKENRRFARMSAEMISLQRKEGIEDTKFIKEWVMAAIGGWQYCPHMPPQEIPYLLKPGTTKYDTHVPRIEHDAYREKLSGLRQLVRNPHFANLIQAALRLLEETWEEPVFYEMLSATFDLEALVSANGVLVILGSDDEYLNKLIFKTINYRLIRLVKRHWAQRKQPLRHRIWIDESSTIVSMLEADATIKTLKMGQSWCLISQKASYGDPIVDETVEAGCAEKVMMHPGSVETMQRNAQHMKLRLDPKKVLYETDRVITEGYDEVQTVSTSEHHTDDGLRKGTHKGTTFRPKLRGVRDPHYQSLSDQETINEMDLIRLGPGEFFLRRGRTLEGPLYVPMLDPPFGYEGVADEYVEMHLGAQVKRGVSRLIVESRAPCPPQNGNGKKPRTKAIAPSLR